MLVLPFMAYFNRDSRGGGRDFNNKDRGSFSRGPRRPVQMYPAVCGNCGKDCEVPFRPTAGKPVYCSDCFDRDTTPRRENFSNRNESRSSFRSEGPRESFHAVCANCGKDCTLPFEPRTNKPVYCSDCFEKQGGDTRKREQTQSQPQNTKQFDALNAKLDKILELLGAGIEVKNGKREKSEEKIGETESNLPEVKMSKEEIIETSSENAEIVTEIKSKRVKKPSKIS